MERQPISREGYEKIREEIRRLEEDEMPKVVENIAAARAEGDLSENAEFHGQREEQGRLQAKINQLKSKLAGCEIVERGATGDTVAFGSLVTVKDLSDGTEEKYQLVGPGEENYDGEVMKILTSSPIGTGLMGKKAGQTAEIPIPNGTLQVEILAVQ